MQKKSLNSLRVNANLRRILGLVFVVALVVRVLYWIFIAPRVLGPEIFIHPDTWAFVAPATNLREIGVYTCDPEFHDGLFTRVPGYALILWVLGFLTTNIYPLVAACQVVVDSLTAVMLAWLTAKAGGRIAALLSGLIYATYPFVLWWVTVTVPDVLTTALAVGGILLLTRPRHHPWRDSAIDGAYLALATLSREYLILLACPMAVSWLLYLPSWRARLQTAAIAGVVAIAVYAPWPLRNFINHHEVVIFRAASSGYRQYASDTGAALDWMATWTPRQGDYLERIVKAEPLDPPPHVLTAEEEFQAERLFQRARECGSGIRLWGGQAEPEVDCNAEIVDGFHQLKKSYISRHPIRWLFEVPLLNLHKTFFKSELVKPTDVRPIVATLSRIAFAYRSILLLGGLCGLIVFRKRKEVLLVAAFSVPMYLFMAGYIRGLQMRYLLQADVLLFAPFSVLVVSIVRSKFGRRNLEG